MHAALSDLVTCPRCGPTYGLVLLPHEIRDRRVVRGVLGCANCRERYTIEGGVADLRVPGEEAGVESGGADAAAASAASAGVGAPERAVRLAALMDLVDAHGTVLIAGPAAADAPAVAALAEGVEVVAVASPAATAASAEGVSHVRAGRSIPFRNGSLRAVVLTGGHAAGWQEGARLVAPGGRLVLEPVPAEAGERLAAVGMRTLVEEEGTLVAAR